ncbi:hypothetical protein [Metabacillus fastidiosus]|uniref:hypothetical protein n=1 Tax=Metabacillus fastidiosus TaxID=1458 RepID=UPI002E1BFA80|nr:hypothetical protein [Metabacillus fastidiosus]
MVRFNISILLLLLLSGCQTGPTESHTTIDWVDFIKLENTEYNVVYNGVIADEKYISEKVGKVNFKVADNISDPGYKIKNGDAAFHEKGTEIYRVKDKQYLIAVKEPHEINEYRIYFARDKMEDEWHLKNMPMEKVKRVEIYHTTLSGENKKITELTSLEEINQLLYILKKSENKPDFQPSMRNGDPEHYEIVFYTSDPIAHKYNIQFDGITFYWYPWETAVLSNDISNFINKNNKMGRRLPLD